MEEYIDLEIEVIFFDKEDVIDGSPYSIRSYDEGEYEEIKNKS